ncbi:hypothetical protein [Acidiphilium sp.]|uniref:hypothetical protein n=1 Tax=Acidiphilium sp. TaxID=527 RepID=UPI002590FE5B|nr:hypothetical protein [Acidiphilium sp.]
MNAAARLMSRLEAAGVAVELSPDGENLAWRAPAPPPPSLLAEVRDLKPAILDLLARRGADRKTLSARGEGISVSASPASPMMPPVETKAEIETTLGLPMADIIHLVEWAHDAPAGHERRRLQAAARRMLTAGHGRMETLQTLLPALPLRFEQADAELDIEREAIQAEERTPMLPAQAHAKAVRGLRLAASPLAGTPGAWPCPACGRGMWISSSWPGPKPTICRECEIGETS